MYFYCGVKQQGGTFVFDLGYQRGAGKGAHLPPILHTRWSERLLLICSSPAFTVITFFTLLHTIVSLASSAKLWKKVVFIRKKPLSRNRFMGGTYSQ